MSNKLKCQICGRKFSGNRRYNSLSKHLNSHNIHSKEGRQFYYDKYMLKNNKEKMCSYCGNKTKFLNLSKGYQKHCCPTCAAKNEETRNKYKETMKEKYGVDHNWKYNDEGYRKCDETIKNKYGGLGLSSQIIKNKYKKTMKEKYGVDHNWKGEYGSRSCDITSFEKYNGPIFSNEKIRNKCKSTWLEKYGVDNPSKVKKFIDKIKKTKKRKYGDENYNNVKKRRETNLKRYGVTNYVLSKNAWQVKKYKSKFGNVTYMSKPELKFIKICEQHNIFIKNGDIIPYMFKNNKKMYHIDFKIKKQNKWQLIEIKGKHCWFYTEKENGRLKSKIQAAVEHSKKENYLPYKLIFTENI